MTEALTLIWTLLAACLAAGLAMAVRGRAAPAGRQSRVPVGTRFSGNVKGAWVAGACLGLLGVTQASDFSLASFTIGAMRTHGIPATSGDPISLFKTDQGLKQHQAYKLAKGGDIGAALRLVVDLAELLVEQVKQFGSDVIFVAPHALEASGENAIPQTLAAYLAQKCGARDDVNIVQRNKVYHTGADAMQRLIAPSEFTGAVEAGARYVMVDDVSTMGGTLADLASYIQANQGQIVGSVLLVNAARSGKVIPSAKTLEQLERRLGNEIRTAFGIEPAALTWEEAQYLVGFRTADELGNRAAAAQQARLERLRSKGIEL